jgi:hypothetical protein
MTAQTVLFHLQASIPTIILWTANSQRDQALVLDITVRGSAAWCGAAGARTINFSLKHLIICVVEFGKSCLFEGNWPGVTVNLSSVFGINGRLFWSCCGLILFWIFRVFWM